MILKKKERKGKGKRRQRPTVQTNVLPKIHVFVVKLKQHEDSRHTSAMQAWFQEKIMRWERLCNNSNDRIGE